MRNFSVFLFFMLIFLPCCFELVSAEEIPADPLSEIEDLDAAIREWEGNYKKELEEAGITPEEAAQYGYLPIPMEELIPAPGISSPGRLTGGSLPSSYDLRTVDRSTSVRDQGDFGTCWAHGVINSIESAALTQNLAWTIGSTKNTLNLSERQLAYFSYNRGNDPLGNLTGDSVKTIGKTYYDVGGNNYMTPFILNSWTGPVLESDAVYPTKKSGWTNLASSLQYSKDAFHLKNVYRFDINNDRDGVKNAIQTYGACSISYGSYDYYRNDSGYTSYYCPYTFNTNHTVSVIGWNDNYSKYKFKTTAPGNGAWLVKQSWGSSWGSQSGYFWLSYYDQTLADDVFFYEIEPVSVHERIYQYDGASIHRFQYRNKMANVFTAKYDENISAISFATDSSNISYTVKVYTGCTASDPESGTLAATINGSVGNEYIKTVALPEDVFVKKGLRYSVVVDLNGTGSGYYLVDKSETWETISFTSYGCPGQSFYYNAGKWYDLNSKCSKNAIIARIKAYTTGYPAGLEADTHGDDNIYIYLNWTETELPDAKSYEIYSSSNSILGFTRCGTSNFRLFFAYPEDFVYGSTYYFKVRAKLNNGQYSSFSKVVKATMPIPAVSGLKKVSTSGQTAALSWEELENVKQYEIYYAASRYAKTWKKIGTTTGSGFTAQNLPYGDTAYFKVRALFTNKVYSGYSDVVYAYIMNPAIEGLKATVNDQSVNLTWDSLTGVKSYVVYSGTSLSSSSWKKIGTTSKPAFTISKLSYGKTYYYKVDAVLNSGSCSPTSISVTIPSNVINLQVTFNVKTAFLSWDALSNAKSYEIYLGDSAATTAWTKLGTTENTLFFTQKVLFGAKNFFKVRALFNDGTYSSYSNIFSISIPLPTLTGLKATVSGRSAALSWDSLPSVKSYEIGVGTSAKATSYKKIGTSTGTSFTVSDLIYGGTYYYNVRALMNSGKYSYYSSSPVQVTIAAPSVSGFSVSRSGQTAQLSWSKLDCVKNYEIYSAASASAPDKSWKKQGTSTGLTFDAKNLAYGSTTYFKVRALFTNGKYSGWSGIQSVSVPMPTVSGLTKVITDRSVQLSWTTFTGVRAYEIYSSPSAKKIGSTNKGTFTINNLAYGSTNQYYIRGLLTTGKYCNNSSVITVTIPPQVAGVKVTVSGQTASLSWNALTNAKSYEVYLGNSAKTTAWTKLGTSAGTSFSSQNLLFGVTNYFKVRALFKDNTYSSYSNIVQVSVPLPTLTGLTASVSGSTATLSWSALPGVKSYEIGVGTSAKATSFNKIGTATATSFTVSSLVYGKTYYYNVRALHNSGKYSYYSKTPVQVTIGIPGITGLRVDVNGGFATLTWDNLDNVKYYEIYCEANYPNSSRVKLGTSTTNSFTSKKLSLGNTFLFAVRALFTSGKYSDYTTRISGFVLEEPVENNLPEAVLDTNNTYTAAEPVSFFWLGNDFLHDPNRPEMPATGFPTGHFTPLPSVHTSTVTQTGITLRIPSLNLNAEVVELGLDEQTLSYDVSVLDNRLGSLEGTELPGEGFSILVGHNHLNTMEAGPFAYLYSVEENDRLFITDVHDAMSGYSVYANLLLDADDYQSIADNAKENALILITCEDETSEGTYLHRRVIFAEPLG